MSNKLKYCDFADMKNRHLGETAIFLGSGPTNKKFDHTKVSDVIFVGVNETIFRGIPLDYLVVGDGANPAFKTIINDFHNYNPKIEKLIGIDVGDHMNITKVVPGSIKNALHYQTKFRGDFSKNLEKELVARYGSISFDVMQILAFMGFSKIYLVGHDCNYSTGTFHRRFNGGGAHQKLIDHWNLIKIFLDSKYPQLKVESVNPVSLTIFKDSTNEIIEAPK
tara:strand:- start:4194 stop:4859 length:666 start_codon:yes stop_codon:yes gene_type:complete